MSFKVKAVYEYNSGHDDDLKFNVGQIITVIEQEDDDWYAGEYVDESGVKQEGIFPRNFVEKYEPTAPPRPTRTRTKNHPEQQSAASDSPAPAPAPLASPKLPAHDREPEREEEKAAPATKTAPAPPPEPAAVPEPTSRKSTEIKSPPAAPKPAPAPAPAPQPAVTSPPPAKPTTSQSKPAPPPVTEKPSSFKDRIAAFNKSAAPPIAPFKPSGLGAGGGAGFIKKPFVAPPPSRNAYVPPVQSAPVAKVYRRDEDPEIKEREAETQESAEKAGLVPGAAPAAGAEAGGEDEPKPMSLKERLALLQKQQLENAQRHADAVAKKEKPKRPAKKRMESHDGHGHPEEAEAGAPAPPPPDRRGSEDVSRKSTEEPHPPRVPHPARRRSSKGPEPHDGNEADMSGAGETTEGQEDDLTEREDSDHQPKHIATAAKQDDERLDEEEVVDEEDEDEDEEEDDVDPEIRRKEELRARMARIAGGMGGMGGMGAIFGGGMPSGAAPAAPPKRKKSVAPEASEEAASPGTHAPPIPTMMALPGMSRVKSAEKPPPQEEEESEEDEDEAELRTPHQESAPHFAPREAGGPPPVPGGRPAPPPVPTESRPPPAPPAAVESESQGSQSDDELSERGARGESAPAPSSQATRAPPPLPPLSAPSSMLPTSPTSASSNRRSIIGDGAYPTSPTAGAPPPLPENRRNSRAPPPLPGAAPALPPNQSRPPPPPPPAALSRSSTADTQGPLSPTRQVPHAERLNEEEEVTEYEGDYDTDIASSAPHKDALKSHQRESSFEDNTSVRSPASEAPPSMPPPLPNISAPRGPPPIPSQPPPETSRRSVDAPRAAPPPPPKEAPRYGDDDYDPFNYASPPPVPSVSHPPPPPPPSRPAEDPYEATSPYQSPPPDRRGPPPAPPSAAPAPPSRANTRQSLDVQRPAAGSSRRSVDVARPSMESGFVANELDLASNSGWWLKADSLPPQLQGRKDIYFESEESTSSNPRGKTIITRDIYVLYQDYSQTVITVRFDPHDASDVDLSQRHEAPPRTLRQDQLEQSYERFGRAIGDSVSSKQNTVIGDGTPQALIYDLLRPHRDALLPVGTRAYGALVYSNLANASTTQNDEIRPGDIISIRNAKFQGKHGPMHAKYSVEVGKPDHVGIVAEWDGTKKKVRAWEQGRESKKVKMESFKLDDLRSGEVKIWRVMPRSWVGWEGVGN